MQVGGSITERMARGNEATASAKAKQRQVFQGGLDASSKVRQLATSGSQMVRDNVASYAGAFQSMAGAVTSYEAMVKQAASEPRARPSVSVKA
jgi:hypothetical protein